MAHGGLAAHIMFLEEENEPIPEPRALERIQETWEDRK